MPWNIVNGNTPLENKKVYLSGPIQHDSGKNWRIEPTLYLREIFKLDVFDPFEDPKQQWSVTLKEAQIKKDFKTMRKISKRFVRKDLSIVDEANFIIAYLPYKVPTFGSTHEIISSNDKKKPTLIVCPEGKEFVPLWFYGFIKHEYMFGSWKDLYAYLAEVDSNKHKKDNRWSRVYGLI